MSMDIQFVFVIDRNLYRMRNSFHIWFHFWNSVKLIDIYRTRHNISASTSLSDPAVATGISELIYESTKVRIPDIIYESSKPKSAETDEIDDDLVNFWAAGLGDDGLLGNNAPAMNRVRIYHTV